MPVQIIVTRELDREKNFWLRSLTNELESNQEALDILHRYKKNQENELYRSVLDIIVKANLERFGEEKMLYDTLEELLAERIQKRVKENGEIREKHGEKRGEKRFMSLTSHLLKDHRLEELQKATENEDYRNSLYQEYGLSAMVMEEDGEYLAEEKPQKKEE